MRNGSCFAVAIVLAVVAVATGQDSSQKGAGADNFSAEQVTFFETRIKPLLEKRCFKCHGGGKAVRGNLRLTSRAGILKGGDTGPAVSLNKPEESLLLQAINYESYEMPPDGKLPQKERDLFAQWVSAGLPWTPGDEPAAEPAEEAGSPQVNAETRSHWAFQPIERPAVPAVKRRDWIATPVDAFILARLEEAGLQPSPPASKPVLIRRAYYDLLGLPPTPEQVREFLDDDSPDAYERLVDRLLDSPHYGEKWARHWLDLVRYAETNSYERDGLKPYAWRYRDYVIRSFNRDKPYTRFVREQLAGDELDEVTRESLIATGYYRLGIWQDEPVDPEKALYDDLDDILRTTGEVFLGLRIGCARCHEHKLDPIPQEDYYRMLAFFSGLTRFGVRSYESIEKRSLRSIATEEQKRRHAEAVAEHEKKVAEVAAKLKAIEALVRDEFSGLDKEDFQDEANRVAVLKRHVPDALNQKQFEQYVALTKQRDRLRKFTPPALDMALCVTEIGAKPRETHVLVRGNPHVKGPKVEPGFPQIFGVPDPEIPEPGPNAKTSARRRMLAGWIADENNPLSARVMVNRIWQYHFGRGIVGSPNNFGLQGSAPTHPKLLDWLASEFIARGWRMKPLHKLIMLSSAYRMSSRANRSADFSPHDTHQAESFSGRVAGVDPASRGRQPPGAHPEASSFAPPDHVNRVERPSERRPAGAQSEKASGSPSLGLQKDPQNRLFWRFNMRRLEAEEIRDSILAVNGSLNLKDLYGPSIYPIIPEAVLAGQSRPGAGWGKSSPEQRDRRSIYIHIKRSLLVPVLESFDYPATDITCPARFSTTQPTQALGMLNSEFLGREAKVFAEFLKQNVGEDTRAQVESALRRTLQREPSEKEIDRGVNLINDLQQEHGADGERALEYFCLMALNLNEFLYLD